MKYKAIFFDLDGTLLPMDYGTFTKGYFGELYKVVAPTGLIDAENFVAAIWKGTKAMMKNDGIKSNETVFWETFAAVTGLPKDSVALLNGMCDGFYTKEFHLARRFTGENPQAAEAVALASCKGKRKVILATNPLFPRVGQLSRISWIGLSEDDFELITSYEEQYYCKPNPQYYIEICKHIGLSPSECLMIGNDEREDVLAAKAAGLDGYLVTDCLISCEGDERWQGERGSFSDMLEMLRNLE